MNIDSYVVMAVVSHTTPLNIEDITGENEEQFETMKGNNRVHNVVKSTLRLHSYDLNCQLTCAGFVGHVN